MGGFRYLFRYRNGIGSQKYSGADAGRDRRLHVAPFVAEHEGLRRINVERFASFKNHAGRGFAAVADTAVGL